MIGPPGLPNIGRRVFRSVGTRPATSRERMQPLKWAAALYFAGVLAHFSHHMAFDLPAGIDPSFGEALASAPISLVWPADLIETLITMGGADGADRSGKPDRLYGSQHLTIADPEA